VRVRVYACARVRVRVHVKARLRRFLARRFREGGRTCERAGNSTRFPLPTITAAAPPSLPPGVQLCTGPAAYQ